jgi:hypothetical protein
LGTSIVPGIDLTKLANSQIHWEVARKTDIAVEGIIMKDFFFEFIYFSQKRDNIPLPAMHLSLM